MTDDALKVYEKAESLDEELFNKYNESWYESLVKNYENNPNHKIYYLEYDEDKTNPIGSKDNVVYIRNENENSAKRWYLGEGFDNADGDIIADGEGYRYWEKDNHLRIYKGEFRNGVPNGNGVILNYMRDSSKDDLKITQVFRGEIYNAVPDGYGVRQIFDENEEVVRISGGIFSNGLLDGYGYEINRNENNEETRVQGFFENDYINKGILIYSDNSKYEGELSNGIASGKGSRKWNDGETYQGDWGNGVPHGSGVYKYKDGTTYTGEFKNFLWHGNGTAEYPDGSKYIGEFQNGLWHGKGEYQSPDGSSQKGDYQNGIFQPDDT